MVGQGPDSADEFEVTRLSMSRPNRAMKSPDDRDSKDHRGNLSIARGGQSMASDDRNSKGHRGNRR